MKLSILLQASLLIICTSNGGAEKRAQRESVSTLSINCDLLLVVKNEPEVGYNLQAFRLNKEKNMYSLSMSKSFSGGEADRILIHKNFCVITSCEEFGKENSVTLARILDLSKDGLPEVKVFTSVNDVELASWKKIPNVGGLVLWNVLEPTVQEDSVIFTGHPTRLGVNGGQRSKVIINFAKMTLEILFN